MNVSIKRVDGILSGIQTSCKIIAAEIVRDIKRDYESYVDAIPQLEKELKRIADSIVFIKPLAEESGLEEEINLKKLELENWKKRDSCLSRKMKFENNV